MSPPAVPLDAAAMKQAKAKQAPRRSVLKSVGLLVVTLAVSIGLVGKLKPSLFMSLPNGFILWVMTGNDLPPYFSPAAWEKDTLASWSKDGDVVVAAGAKSGTNWMLHCSHAIRTKGDNVNFPYVDVLYTTPWPDLTHTPGRTFADEYPRWHSGQVPPGADKPLREMWDNAAYPFRVFKSHYTPKEEGGKLPIKDFPKLKFVAMARNGLDVIASLVPFFDQHDDNFRKLWGGFPPSTGVTDGNYTAADAEARLTDLLPGGTLEALYFSYVKQWWPLRDEPNVLLLHYADAKKDLAGTIRTLATFYDVALSDAQFEAVEEQCGMPYMKQHASEFNYVLHLNEEEPSLTAMVDGKLINKGVNGQGKLLLSEEQQARWAAAEEAQLGSDPAMLKWAREGGGAPGKF